MVDDRPVNFDMESAMLIKKTVDAHMSRIINKVPGGSRTGRRDRPPIYHVKATSEIPAATDSLTGEGRGVARIYRLDTNSELIATEDLLDVVNRNTSASYAVGDYFEVELRSSEWIPLVAGGVGTVTIVLDEALAAATNALTAPGTAVASVLQRTTGGDLEDSGDNIDVVNRFENVDLVQYTIAQAQWIDGEWRVVAADCGALGSWP